MAIIQGSDSIGFNSYAAGGWKVDAENQMEAAGATEVAQWPSQLEGCEVGNNGSSTLEEVPTLDNVASVVVI